MGSRATGQQRENQAAALLDGERISKPGLPGPDVVDSAGNLVEVKYGKQVPLTIYNYMDQMFKEGAAYTVVKRPYKPWLVLCYMDDWKFNGYHEVPFVIGEEV